MTPDRLVGPGAGDWHIVTCEYPPQVGGVSDHSLALASGLAAAGHGVHVWCPAIGQSAPETRGVTVHQDLDGFSPASLRLVGKRLNAFPLPRRLFVQWVPHGFGYRSLNLPFALWVAWRAWLRHDELHVMIHEPFLRFSFRPLQFAAALVHRVMLTIACSRATHLWLSIPIWAESVRPYVSRRTPLRWLPIPAPILRGATSAVTHSIRQRIAPPGTPIVGHFGAFSPLVTRLLEPALDVVLLSSSASVLLVGRDGDKFCRRFLETRPHATNRVHATGVLDASALSAHLRACDVMIQPYPDGISARRTSTLALMAQAVPVVTNGGRLTESFWADGGAVTFVDQPDGRRLGQAAVDMLRDEPGRRRLARMALAMYDRLFDIRHAVAAIEAGS